MPEETPQQSLAEDQNADDALPSDIKSNPPESEQGGPVLLNDNIEIYPSQYLPEYDRGPVKAYKAKLSHKTETDLFALICEPHLVPRRSAVEVYRALSGVSIAQLVQAGTVYWPPSRCEHYVFLYKDTLGRRILPDENIPALGWSFDKVKRAFIEPMVHILNEFRNKDFVHGAIRPFNMFDGGAGKNLKTIILGDCLSLPPSYDQPVLYETIERAMADPIGRGIGTIADDMYAFGVSLAVLLRSPEHFENIKPDQIIRNKIEQGSFATMVGRGRFKGTVLELLRGLLQDDAEERWTIDDVMTWLDGRRLNPKQSPHEKKAPRPIIFSGKKYFYKSLLAMDLQRDAQDLKRIIEDSSLEKWLVRALEDRETLEHVENALEKSEGPRTGHEDRLSAYLSMALHPAAPFRYKGLNVMGYGIGAAMVKAHIKGENMKPFIEAFTKGFVMYWVDIRQAFEIDAGFLFQRFDTCRNVLRQSRSGYGLERCIYTLVPDAQCLSEELENYVVTSPEDMIFAFEDLSRKENAPAFFIDRHCAAFLAAHDSKMIEPALRDISSTDEKKRIFGDLTCLATIQKRSNLGLFPAISGVFAERLPAVYDMFHSHENRQAIRKKMQPFIEKGDLAKMVSILNNPDFIQQDILGFQRAANEYKALTQEVLTLRERLKDSKTFGRETGRKAAALISSMLAIIIIASLAIFYL